MASPYAFVVLSSVLLSASVAEDALHMAKSALHVDDECSMSGRQDCAWNALQMRKSTMQSSSPEQQVQEEVMTGENLTQSVREDKSEPVDSEAVAQVTAAPETQARVAVADPVVVPKRVLSWQQLKNVVEASEQGETIHIPRGITLTFKGTININEGMTFNIFSEGATLDGKNEYGRVRLFYVRGRLNLTGFLLKNGKTDYAGAMYFDFGSSGDLTNCSFYKNEATYMGGAIVSKGAQLRFTNVNFRSNSAENTCKSKLHCSRRRRNGRRANAVYILSHTKFDASMRSQPRSQDIFFDKDFDGRALFHCARPRMEATDHRVARHHVHMAHDCNISLSDEE